MHPNPNSLKFTQYRNGREPTINKQPELINFDFTQTYGSLYHPEEHQYQPEHHEYQPEHLIAYQPQQQHIKRKPKGQDFSKIPGTPGVDYPILHEVPHTKFHCGNVPATPGMYANVETGCQAYHVCHDGREGHQGASFLCTNGTVFNQKEFTCDWWYNVNCADAPQYYQ